jgi:hypothetical protein
MQRNILTTQEKRMFDKLSSPAKIQDFLNALRINFEKRGPTLYSPRLVLKKRIAHCFEGALLAAAALWYHGEKPLLLDLTPYEPDEGHVLALYRRNGHWGALSKTNHATLRFRDPVYRTIRELALSYFHEYFLNKTGEKTLHSFTPRPFSLLAFGTSWVTSEEHLWRIHDAINKAPHARFIPKGNARYIRKADPIERKTGAIVEWKKNESEND